METSRRDDESTVSTQEFREGSAEQEEVYSRSVEGKRTTETKREFAERRCGANLLYKWWPPASIRSSGLIERAHQPFEITRREMAYQSVRLDDLQQCPGYYTSLLRDFSLQEPTRTEV